MKLRSLTLCWADREVGRVSIRSLLPRHPLTCLTATVLAIGFGRAAFAQASGSLPVPDVSVASASWEGKTKAQARAHVGSLLRRWVRPQSSSNAIPSCFVRPATIAGYWIGGGDPGSCLHIGPEGRGQYSVVLLADSHEAQWRLERRATFANGAARLSGPIMDTDLVPFDALYPVASGDRTFLVSGSALGELRAFVERKGCAEVSEQWLSHTLWIPARPDAQAYCHDMLRVPGK
jgi:hypothetical protein